MTYERSTQTHGRTAAIDRSVHFRMYGDLYGKKHYYGPDSYVQSGGNYIRREYNWDDSYRL